MIVSKYFSIDGKDYVEAADYDKALYELESAKEKIYELEKKLSGKIDGMVKLPLEPVDAASMLINARIEYETNSLQRAFGAGEKALADRYSDDDLRQIAEHLLVYCNHNSEDEGE
mgnify:CR=1 FL=1